MTKDQIKTRLMDAGYTEESADRFAALILSKSRKENEGARLPPAVPPGP